MTDSSNDGRDQETGRFVTGAKGGPGRPKGSRNKLGEQFLSDLQALWETDGAEVLAEARQDKPMEFAKMIASLLPKELLVRQQPMDEMSDNELADILAVLRGIAEQQRDNDAGHRPH